MFHGIGILLQISTSNDRKVEVAVYMGVHHLGSTQPKFWTDYVLGKGAPRQWSLRKQTCLQESASSIS